jgi:DtxR family Mn-dependent transcriptional regulator
MSDSVERRIATLLGSPTSCPHGNPIPGLDELATLPNPSSDGPLVTLEQAAAGGSEKAVVRRISEQIQPDADIMRDLRSAGVQPGRTVRLAAEGTGLTLTTDDGATTVDGITARHVFVSVV